MKLIFISGPSGSGKTTLSNQIIKKNKNGIVLSTDNYYKTGLISKLCNRNFYFFELKINKNECMERVVQRDIKERGKSKKQAENDFLKSWDIYYEKFKPNSIKNNKNKFIIEKKTDIDHILKKLFN